MSHVSEGALHAYLDGALDEYPAAEARRVREHLESCAACAGRLEEERKIRQDATAMLALAVPNVELPSFEELRAYVKAMPAPPSRASVRLRNMGWAASVVLALGAGWMVREGQLGRMPVAQRGVELLVPVPADAVVSDRDAADLPRPRANADQGVADVASTESRGAGVLVERQREVPRAIDALGKVSTTSRELLLPQPESEVVAEAAFDDVDLGASRELRLEEAITPAASSFVQELNRVGVPENERAAGAGAAVDELAVEEPTQLSVARDVQATPVSAPVELRVAERRRIDARDQAAAIRVAPSSFTPAVGGQNTVEDFDEADVRGSLVVPGLRLISYSQVAEGTIPGGIHVLQRLDNDEILDVYHLPEGVAPSSLPPLENGRNEVRAERDGGWVILRAALPTQALWELLARLGPEG